MANKIAKNMLLFTLLAWIIAGCAGTNTESRHLGDGPDAAPEEHG